MFKHLTGDTAIVRKNGVFRTCDLYSYKGQLFVKYGAGFIRLNSDGGSSVDTVQLDMLVYDGPLYKDRFGRLCVEPSEGLIALQVNVEGLITTLSIEGPTK